MSLTIPCRSCAGSGRQPLPFHLALMLRLVTQRGQAAAPALRHAYRKGVGGLVVNGAVNNALEDLRALGYLEREKDGRLYVYRPVQR